jgi:hypothetical protein
MTIRTMVLAFALTLSSAAVAQQPYAGQQVREIKALSAEEIAQYLAGAGMGFAKAAELNQYPGPMHTLELADQLSLSVEQRAAMESLMKRHKAEARELGAEVVRLERELDALFAEKRATSMLVDAGPGRAVRGATRLQQGRGAGKSQPSTPPLGRLVIMISHAGIESEPLIRIAAFVGVFAAVALWEALAPRRQTAFGRGVR